MISEANNLLIRRARVDDIAALAALGFSEVEPVEIPLPGGVKIETVKVIKAK